MQRVYRVKEMGERPNESWNLAGPILASATSGFKWLQLAEYETT